MLPQGKVLKFLVWKFEVDFFCIFNEGSNFDGGAGSINQIVRCDTKIGISLEWASDIVFGHKSLLHLFIQIINFGIYYKYSWTVVEFQSLTFEYKNYLSIGKFTEPMFHYLLTLAVLGLLLAIGIRGRTTLIFSNQ